MQDDPRETWLEQQAICRKYGLEEVHPEAMVAVALSSLGQSPVYGSRIILTDNNNVSWFFHCGEPSTEPDFYSPVHTSHLDELLPSVIKYLYLPPKTRFIIDNFGYEDIWQDD